MQKNISIISILLCLILKISPMISNASTQTNNDKIIYYKPNNFITNLMLPLPSMSTDKNILIQELDELIKDIKNNPDMALAFNILFNSYNLSSYEKKNWLQQNISKLPTPFMLLRAMFEEDINLAKKIYFLASARILIDANMCVDASVQEGIIGLKHIVLHKILKRFDFDIDTENPDLQKNKKIMEDIEKDFFNSGGFKRFDQEYPVVFTQPYWLAYHGIQAMIYDDKDSDDSLLFRPVKEYTQIKEKVFKELERYATERGNFKTS